MAVTEWSARSRASVNASIAHLENVCKPDAFSGRLIIFDKTIGGSDYLGIIESCPQIKIDILHRQANESLRGSVVSLAQYLDNDSQSWVQVLAEDDVILSGQDFSFSPAQETVMFLPDVLLVGEKNLLDSRGELHKLSNLEYLGEMGGDTSWHGVVRERIMLRFCLWLASIGEPPFEASNQLVFLALSYGRVERLRQFVFVKEASAYDYSGKVLERRRQHMLKAYGDERLAHHSDLLNLLAAISLISNCSWDSDYGRREALRNSLIRKLQQVCAVGQPQRGVFHRVVKIFRPNLGPSATAPDLSQLLDIAEIRLGDGGPKVLQNFGLR